MKHIEQLQSNGQQVSTEMIVRATGRFYTHPKVAAHLVKAMTARAAVLFAGRRKIRIVDPFAGDGRLVEWLIKAWQEAGLPIVKWDIELWDIDETGLLNARSRIEALQQEHNLSLAIEHGDAFALGTQGDRRFDIVVTNPPWELLKPDRRELASLSGQSREEYITSMREYDAFLAKHYPLSQPAKKFAGWGTNLSRVGIELSASLCNGPGMIGIVMPASFLADDQSEALRRRLFETSSLEDVAYYPAEAKLFGKADVASITAVYLTGQGNGFTPMLTRYDTELSSTKAKRVKVKKLYLAESGYVLPVSMGSPAISLLQRLPKDYPSWDALENDGSGSLWAGRECDETRSTEWLDSSGQGPLFVKGKMIERFQVRELPSMHVEKPNWVPPQSVAHERMVWRDVSRPNQKRRMIATIVPPGWTAGNSLGVAHFADGNPDALRALLGVASSLVFEFQLRAYLATGHVSLSSLRKVRLPAKHILLMFPSLIELVDAILSGDPSREPELEALVAKRVYRLTRKDLQLVLSSFQKLTEDDHDAILAQYDSLDTQISPEDVTIPNHNTARLSDLDMEMVRTIPPGGNWKSIPESIPSKRLDQIRVSYKEGKGSRSTYYGRLKPDMPSYTINTYFNRPGNGCHIHYEQDRVLSQREAARFQSFPDSFVFLGPQGSVNTQIGNAVPPLLAYQIAKILGKPGYFVDLFAGAGGLGLGFKWAGWTPIVANDIEPRFLDTYTYNVHSRAVLGSITDSSVRAELVKQAKASMQNAIDAPLWVLGGPPCQGFSTAGYKRVVGDDRNLLFLDYRQFIEELRPDGFVFENVTGLLNMHGGRVFQDVKNAFHSVMPSVSGWVLKSEEYAIPQRRSRVFLVGSKHPDVHVEPPTPITGSQAVTSLFTSQRQVCGAKDTISDLPALNQGEKGESKAYRSEPRTPFQALMRGLITPESYLQSVRDSEPMV